ncbi:hypothetical protein DIU31_028235 [Mucilaginibacter rubeus]|uniref:DUF2971 domain-containing protein n=1 Tax=Mucilaginibacter rubeus TaxID=2027860 RepID=A0AAE6JJU9_9SPHI|nr:MULTISPECIES: hypothetical protein [Mucilaginibacter]QEM07197.1 hypothetical protein DIU31_028235 [Mucilaginibacter rubeus]QEM19653.1 hypothetical protein DIU38_027810 [Mucilaginibacter gossypii]QTE43651.1 hypothetical protein J3L19_32820 [Mucilaginibacter rubeus]QTE50251.1 hypothetical protein J3L21_32775 [Mucilaginibacter rubeus]QTE55339.1 hypothetical protein J3L23_24395 [Mucilaginibacter rubeus]
MYKENKQLQNPPDDTILFRYMDFISFYSLLRNQNLFFKLIDCYTDKLEGLLVEETIESKVRWLQKIDPYMSLTEATQRANEEAEHIKDYRQWTLSSSWNMDNNESYAMWKIYLRGSGEGVAIKTTVGKLKAQLASNTKFEFTGGSVTYEALSHFNVGQFHVSANKRPPYAYEKEYRVLAINQYDKLTKEPLFEIGAAVDMNMEQLIDQVYISPFATGWFESMIKQLLTDRLPNLNNSDVVWSKIQDV